MEWPGRADYPVNLWTLFKIVLQVQCPRADQHQSSFDAHGMHRTVLFDE
jgi:hypothetical protein